MGFFRDLMRGTLYRSLAGSDGLMWQMLAKRWFPDLAEQGSAIPVSTASRHSSHSSMKGPKTFKAALRRPGDTVLDVYVQADDERAAYALLEAQYGAGTILNVRENR